MSSIYPVNVDPKEYQVNKLVRFFTDAYKRILSEMNGASDFTVARRKKILRQIDEYLGELGENVQDYVDKTLPGYYKRGAKDAINQLNNIGANVKVDTGFSQLHKEAIIALVDDTMLTYANAIDGIKRDAMQLLGKTTRDLIKNEIAQGVVTGEARQRVVRQIKGILAEDGLAALTDRGGKRWKIDRYAEMVYRTKVVEARNLGLTNRLLENEYDLVQCSDHFGECPLCRPWENEILSLTGQTKGYETLAKATSEGLFHPNCRHAINSVVPSLARKTRAYDPKTGKYGTPGATVAGAVEKKLQNNILGPAADYQSQFKKDVRKIANTGDWDYTVGPVKKAERSVEKVMADYNGDVFALKDSNRSALFIDDPNSQAEFDRMVEAVREVYGNASVKEGLNTQTSYAKSMINTTLDDGRVIEIQVTTKEMWKAKIELGGDDLYDIVRVKAKDWQEAEQKMLKLYEAAREETEKRLTG